MIRTPPSTWKPETYNDGPVGDIARENPPLPPGTEIDSVDVVIRVRSRRS